MKADDTWFLVDTSHRDRSEKVEAQLSGRVCINDTDAMQEMAIAGRGIALLPAWAVGRALREGKSVRLLPG